MNKSLKNTSVTGSIAQSTLNINKNKSRMHTVQRAEGTRSMLTASREPNYFAEKKVSISKYLDQ